MGSGTKRRTLLVRPEEEQPTALECDIGRVASSRFLRVMYSVPQELYESLVADEAADAAAAAMSLDTEPRSLTRYETEYTWEPGLSHDMPPWLLRCKLQFSKLQE